MWCIMILSAICTRGNRGSAIEKEGEHGHTSHTCSCSLGCIAHYNHLPHRKVCSHLHTIKDCYSRSLQFNFISESYILWQGYLCVCTNLTEPFLKCTYTVHTPHCRVSNSNSKQMYLEVLLMFQYLSMKDKTNNMHQHSTHNKLPCWPRLYI